MMRLNNSPLTISGISKLWSMNANGQLPFIKTILLGQTNAYFICIFVDAFETQKQIWVDEKKTI